MGDLFSDIRRTTGTAVDEPYQRLLKNQGVSSHCLICNRQQRRPFGLDGDELPGRSSKFRQDDFMTAESQLTIRE
jgi:hypothetical protein